MCFLLKVTYDARAAVRFRSLDGAICMPSRYLATVRRATGMPSCDRISASLLSLHGFSGFSCEINFLILARMPVADNSVPQAPPTWPDKKDRPPEPLPRGWQSCRLGTRRCVGTVLLLRPWHAL